MNIATATRMDLTDKEGVPTEVLEAKANIIKTLKIQEARGNKEASFILKHL